LFKIDDIELTFDESALEYIVDKAVEYKLGARGLRSICEAIMMDAMFELPSSDEKTVTIDAKYAASKLDKANMKHLRIA